MWFLDVCIVDGLWYLFDVGCDLKVEYDVVYILNVVFFDIDEICDIEFLFFYMFFSVEKFFFRVCNLGFGDGNYIIVYDGVGLFSVVCVWWMFKIMGYSEVVVLDGGFFKW